LKPACNDGVIRQDCALAAHVGGASRSWTRALLRGSRKRCPQCGHGRLFAGYARTAPACSACGADFSGHRADDAPPYVTTLLVGHVAIPVALAFKQALDPPLFLQIAVFLPATVAAALVLLPATKGALIGVQWANRMHGFAPEGDDDALRRLDSQKPVI
jgi:uncharacterized protein (DUF983 family)